MDLPIPVDIHKADYPPLYAKARNAIAHVERIDELREFSNKAAALASYAKMANDDELENMAKRIRLRAERRCGEVLKAIPPSPGGRPPETTAATGHSFSAPGRWQQAHDAGMSDRQIKTSLNLAAIPEAEFEQCVEQTPAPTITEMREMVARLHPSRVPAFDKEKDVERCPTCGQSIMWRYTR